MLAAATTALGELAQRWHYLNHQIKALDTQLAQLLPTTAPNLLALHGVALEVTGQLLDTAGGNPDRLTSEAAFARLCGVAPQPVSSGRTTRHRPSRSGDRAANRALYMVVITPMRTDPRTQAYVQRRTNQGRTNARPSAASSATPPAKSSPPSKPHHHLTQHRSIHQGLDQATPCLQQARWDCPWVSAGDRLRLL